MKKKGFPLEAIISMILFMLMLVFLTAEVTARYLFNTSFVWTEEISRYLFISFVFFTASYAVYENTHIRIDSVMNLFPKKVRSILIKLGRVVLSITAVYITYLTATYGFDLIKKGSISPVTGILQGLFYLGITLGFLFISIRSIISIFKDNSVEDEDGEVHI